MAGLLDGEEIKRSRGVELCCWRKRREGGAGRRCRKGGGDWVRRASCGSVGWVLLIGFWDSEGILRAGVEVVSSLPIFFRFIIFTKEARLASVRSQLYLHWRFIRL